MYRDQKVLFTREQLIFIVETSMDAAFSKVHGSLPQVEGDLPLYQQDEADRFRWSEADQFRYGAVAHVGIFIPILWAQTEGIRVGDGMEDGGFPGWLEFEKLCEDFATRRMGGDFSQRCLEFRDLAEKIVDECWGEYLGQYNCIDSVIVPYRLYPIEQDKK